MNENAIQTLIILIKMLSSESDPILQEQRRLKQMKNLKTGNKIHIKSRRGIYEVVKATKNEIYLTCKIWSYEENPIRVITYDDFKCLAGGDYNLP